MTAKPVTAVLLLSDYVPRIAVFVSRQPHCMYDLLARHHMGEFKAELPLVISNHPDLRPTASGFGAEYHHFPITPETQDAQEAAIIETLDVQRIDVVVLARYIQGLSRE